MQKRKIEYAELEVITKPKANIMGLQTEYVAIAWKSPHAAYGVCVVSTAENAI
jgi:hypothetical protein